MILATASWSVAVTVCLYGSLPNPMWLSLIWTNEKLPAAAPARRALAERLRREDPAAGRPDEPGAGPGHALEEPATVDAISLALVISDGLIFHVLTPVR